MNIATIAEPPRRCRWPILKQLAPDTGGRAIMMDRPVCVVGARSRVHLPLRSSLVSRAHALIVNDASETYVRDLASRNHVFVNGSAQRETVLKGADVLRIGPFAFCYLPADPGGGGAPGEPDEASDGGSDLARPAELEVADRLDPVRIEARTLVIGSRPACDLVLNQGDVSGVHAVVFRRHGRHYLRDLNSESGVFLNGSRVREGRLREGDEIRIGPARLRYLRAAAEGAEEIASEDARRGDASELDWVFSQLFNDLPAGPAGPGDGTTDNLTIAGPSDQGSGHGWPEIPAPREQSLAASPEDFEAPAFEAPADEALPAPEVSTQSSEIDPSPPADPSADSPALRSLGLKATEGAAPSGPQPYMDPVPATAHRDPPPVPTAGHGGFFGRLRTILFGTRLGNRPSDAPPDSIPVPPDLLEIPVATESDLLGEDGFGAAPSPASHN